MIQFKSVMRFLADERGPTAVEYAVMLAMILIVMIVGITAVGGGTNGWWVRSSEQMSTHGF